MAKASELESAFDDAIKEVQKSLKAGMAALGGEPATPYLRKLEEELKLERGRAVDRGAADPDWVHKTVRWVVEWAPETDLTLIAVLGRIARAAPLKIS